MKRRQFLKAAIAAPVAAAFLGDFEPPVGKVAWRATMESVILNSKAVRIISGPPKYGDAVELRLPNGRPYYTSAREFYAT